MKTLTILLLLVTPLLSVAADKPKAFSYTYTFKSSEIPFSITATRSLQQTENNQWKTELKAENFLGKIRETSFFTWQDCIPVTTQYEYLRKGLGQKRAATLTLDQAADKLIATLKQDGKVKREFDIEDNTTDLLSLPVAIQCQLQNNNTDSSRFSLATERRHENIRIEVVGTENVSTPAGKFSAIRVERHRAERGKQNTQMWFAPKHDFALVKIVQTDGNKEYEMQLKSFGK